MNQQPLFFFRFLSYKKFSRFLHPKFQFQLLFFCFTLSILVFRLFCSCFRKKKKNEAVFVCFLRQQEVHEIDKTRQGNILLVSFLDKILCWILTWWNEEKYRKRISSNPCPDLFEKKNTNKTTKERKKKKKVSFDLIALHLLLQKTKTSKKKQTNNMCKYSSGCGSSSTKTCKKCGSQICAQCSRVLSSGAEKCPANSGQKCSG